MRHRTTTATLLVFLCGCAGSACAQATTTHPDELPRAAAGTTAPAITRFGRDYRDHLDAWWQDAVFYEVFVRSFADSTEGPLAGDGIGDLRGLIERLDELNDGDPSTSTDLGVTALWLMPITESPSYHGYDTTDYRTVEPDYGTNDDFRALVAACEARGMHVIIDLVLNHTSNQHPWFTASTAHKGDKRDWYIWRDEDPGYRGPWDQTVWHASPANDSTYFYGLFSGAMPDLNYMSPGVNGEMIDVVRFWGEDMGVHGYRLDAIRHLIEEGQQQDNTLMTHQWLRNFHRRVRSMNLELFTVGEVWAGSDVVTTYVGDQMDAAFEFALADAIIDGVRRGVEGPISAQISRINERYPTGMYATFLRNHDQTRTMEELGGDIHKAKLAAAIQLCLPGVPFIYYGEEIGMRSGKPDPQLRTPMQWTGEPGVGFTTGEPWEAPLADAATVNVEAQRDDPDSLRSWYQRLIRLRLADETLRTGDMIPLRTTHPRVLAFERRLETPDGVERRLCVFNLGDAALEKYTIEGVDGDWRLTGEALSGQRMLPGPTSHPVQTLEPYAAYVFR